MEDSLKVSNLTKEYPKFKLDNVSFNVPLGSITGFIGRNGAGKTTTLKSIMNLIHYSNGEIEVFGKNMKEHELDIKQNIAFTLAELNYYTNKTVRDLTKVTARFFKDFSFEKFDKICEHFSLDQSKKLEQLSRGMQVKYTLAVALSHNAKLLILDEPTSGLDPISRDEILDIFMNLVKDKTRSILFSTHITSDLDKCANNIVYINNGIIKFNGKKEDFVSSYILVSGAHNLLTENIKTLALSYKEHPSEFVALIKKEDKDKLDSNLTFKEPTLEDVMVHLERGKNYEELSL